MLLCVAMLPHDTVLVSVPPEGALGGGDGSPAEAYSPDDMREGQPMELGARKTPLNVEEMEEKVDKMVSGLENQVRVSRLRWCVAGGPSLLQRWQQQPLCFRWQPFLRWQFWLRFWLHLLPSTLLWHSRQMQAPL